MLNLMVLKLVCPVSPQQENNSILSSHDIGKKNLLDAKKVCESMKTAKVPLPSFPTSAHIPPLESIVDQSCVARVAQWLRDCDRAFEAFGSIPPSGDLSV